MTYIVNLQFRLEVKDNKHIPNPVDVSKLIDSNIDGKVTGYTLKFDDLIPFSQEDYNDWLSNNSKNKGQW